MKKVCLYLGTRPNLIKARPLIDAARKLSMDYHIVDTCQHHDYAMQGAYYDELDLPHYRREIEDGTDVVIVVGDTRSTVEGAYKACEMGIPLAHVEAGCRCWDKSVPEEVHRICVDSLSDYLFAPTVHALSNICGLDGKTFAHGDVMYDLYKMSVGMIPDIPPKEEYVLFTMHRRENWSVERLRHWLKIAREHGHVNAIEHHSMLKYWRQLESCDLKGVSVLRPVSYLRSLYLIKNASHVFTDSGGVTREAYWSKRPLTITSSSTAWPEVLADRPVSFGDGNAAYKIMRTLNIFW